MPNHDRLRTGLLLAGACLALSGCIAAVVPIAAGGMMGRRALHRPHRTATEQPVAAAPDTRIPPPVAAASPKTRPVSPDAAAPSSAEQAPAVTPPPLAIAAEPAASATVTWDTVARALAKMAARTPDREKIDVLRPAAAVPVRCGVKPPAVIVDAASVGSGDYLYVGALYTMGYEVVFTSRSAALPVAQAKALAKQGIAAPVRGRTLFVSVPGAEATTRTAIGGHYCVIGIVGSRAADFPGPMLPASPGAPEGWFLVPKP